MPTKSGNPASLLYRPLLRRLALLAAVALAAGLLWLTTASASERAVRLPPPQTDPPAKSGPQTAVLAGGCFWGMQMVFQHVRGVTDVVAGYSGGRKSTANYETVSTGDTGHAESIRITYNPKVISYGKLLQIYFSVATDPTELNRQGPDTGPQYRSNIFYANASQKKQAQAYIEQLGGAHAFRRRIVTRVDPLTGFYPAEAYHQNYGYRHPHSLYIVVNDVPKVQNLKRLFPDYYQDKPVLTNAS